MLACLAWHQLSNCLGVYIQQTNCPQQPSDPKLWHFLIVTWCPPLLSLSNSDTPYVHPCLYMCETHKMLTLSAHSVAQANTA
eukprot:4754103-Amphidinium_carterae.1